MIILLYHQGILLLSCQCDCVGCVGLCRVVKVCVSFREVVWGCVGLCGCGCDCVRLCRIVSTCVGSGRFL